LLREKSAGEFEGGRYGDQARMAAKLKIDPRKYRPKGGESHEDVLQRAITFIKQVTERLLPPKSKEHHTCLVVTHGGFISEF
jgi:broad specificity phosphatase PhoE